MTTNDPRLSLLGDALREAAAADLTGGGETLPGEAPAKRRRPRKRIGTRTTVALAALALAVPAAAIATGVLSPDQEVAESLTEIITVPGAEPTCSTIREGVEYECVVGHGDLRNGEEIKPGDWLGVVEGSWDKKTDRINGGCRSQDAEGTHWLCYTGQESVRQGILMPSALGQYMGPEPSGP